MITRRVFLRMAGLSAATLAFPAGCRGRDIFRLTPGAVLSDLRQDPAIGKLRDCRLSFRAKHIEKLTERGKEAFTIVQRGLFVLGLINAEPEQFNFGVYGPQSSAAVARLQRQSGLPENGEHFGCQELRRLEEALETRAGDHW